MVYRLIRSIGFKSHSPDDCFFCSVGSHSERWPWDESVQFATCWEAQVSTILLAVPREKLIMLYETYPQLGYRLMYNLAADLALIICNTDLHIRGSLIYTQLKKYSPNFPLDLHRNLL